MATIASFIMLTVDGFYEGPDQSFDFWTIDDAFADFSDRQLDTADGLLFGRTTFEGMAGYWTTPEAAAASPGTARRMNELPKLVVSRSLAEPAWGATVVADLDELAERCRGLEERLLVLGSPGLTGSLIRYGLLDELRLMMSPIALGGGRPLAEVIDDRVPLRLVDVQRIGDDNVLLTYRPTPAAAAVTDDEAEDR